jgi:small subunit ribosomal protein S2
MINSQTLPKQAPDYDLRDLLAVGLHFGHQKAKWHPKMAEWIFVEQDGVHIFDLAKTSTQLQLAYNFLYQLGSKGKTVIMVGTKRQADKIVEESAQASGVMYITSRWLGGLITNWEQVQKSLKRMLEIERGLANDLYKNYTKYEQVQLEKELMRLKRFFDGVRNLKSTPDCVIVVDPKREHNAVTEARAAGIPVIALTDSNTDPTGIDIVIPGNDDASKSIKFVVDQLAEAYAAGVSGGKQAAPQAEVKSEKTEEKPAEVAVVTPVVPSEVKEVKAVEPKEKPAAKKPKAAAAATKKTKTTTKKS